MTAPTRWPSRMPERKGPPVGELALMAAMLRGRPSLPGALCREQAPTFDRDRLDGESEAEHADRLTAAREVCDRCPEREGCAYRIERARITDAEAVP